MGEIIDLKAYLRTTAECIVAQVGNEIVEVIDISVAGVRLSRPRGALPRRNLEFRIIPVSAAELDRHRAIPVCGHIVDDGTGDLRIAFASVTAALANVIGSFKDRGAPLSVAGPAAAAPY